MTEIDQVSIVERTFDAWKSNFWLGTAVGGLTPTCAASVSTAAQYHHLLSVAQNPAAQNVYDFHRHIQTKKSHALRLLKYAKAKNPSYPQKLIHPKALIIRSMSENTHFKSVLTEIKKVHDAFTRDPFYRAWAI